MKTEIKNEDQMSLLLFGDGLLFGSLSKLEQRMLYLIFEDENFIPKTTCTFLELVQSAFGDGTDNKSPQLKKSLHI